VVAAFVVPPFLVGFALSLAVLGMAADRVRASLKADEELAASAGMVFGGVRDITAAGTEEFAEQLVGEPIEAHASAERALAKVAALRTLCFAVGGWLPLLILLAAGPWLVGRGVSTGTLLGGLTYVIDQHQDAAAGELPAQLFDPDPSGQLWIEQHDMRPPAGHLQDVLRAVQLGHDVQIVLP
jgi:hypothetical protein